MHQVFVSRDSVAQVSHIITRMRLFKQQIDETIALLEEGVRVGVVMHRVSMETLPDVLKDIAEEEVEKSGAFKPFLTRPEAVGEDEWVKLVEEAKGVGNSFRNHDFL